MRRELVMYILDIYVDLVSKGVIKFGHTRTSMLTSSEVYYEFSGLYLLRNLVESADDFFFILQKCTALFSAEYNKIVFPNMHFLIFYTNL